jgi:hypothetical protein
MYHMVTSARAMGYGHFIVMGYKREDCEFFQTRDKTLGK